MKRFLLFFFILVSSIYMYSQTQQGYVKTRGRLSSIGQLIPGNRLQGATIRVKNGGSYVSGNNGAFAFAVPSQSYILTDVQKKDYQLCDIDVLGRGLKYSSNPLVVVMDIPDQILEDRLESEEKIRATLTTQLKQKKAELKQLKEQQIISQQEYNKLLQELYALQNNNEKLISEMAERYSTLDYEELDEFQRTVSYLIQNGNLIKADSLLRTKDIKKLGDELDQMDVVIQADDEDIAKRQAAHEQAVELKIKKLEEFTSLCYSNYEVCKLKHKNDSAAYWLELGASKDTTNLKWQFELVKFIYDYLSDYQRSLNICQEILYYVIHQFGNNHSDVIMCYSNIAAIYGKMGNYKLALDYYEKAYDIEKVVFGEEHPYTTPILAGIAGLLYDHGEYPRALEYIKKSLNIKKAIWGEEDELLADDYKEIGFLYYKLGDYTQALDYINKSLTIRQRNFGGEHFKVAECYVGIGSVLSSQSKLEDALDYYNKALEIDLNFFGKLHPEIATLYNNIGNVYRHQGKLALALYYYMKSLEIDKVIYGDSHPTIAVTYSNIGSIHHIKRDFKQALEYNNKAMEINIDAFGEDHLFVAQNYENIAFVHSDNSNYSLAIECYEKSLDIRRKLFGEEHPSVATTYTFLGSAYYNQNEYALAIECYNKALYIRKKKYGENSPITMELIPSIFVVYEEARTNNVLLEGYDEFISNIVYTATTVEGDTPARQQGLDGEYVVLGFGDWNLSSNIPIFQKNTEYKDKPKVIVFMKNEFISEHFFKNSVGVKFWYKYVGKEEKQRITRTYRKWQKNNNK